jgi:hypothetical protein
MQVLADYAPAGSAGVWALYPSSRHMVPRIRVLLDFLTRWFRSARSPGDSGHIAEDSVDASPERCLAATISGESRQHA